MATFKTFSKTPLYLQAPQYLLQRRQGAVRKLCQRQVHRSPACRRPPEVRLERERVLDVRRWANIFFTLKYFQDSQIFLPAGEEDRVQYWQARWATGQSQWNSDKPHQYLVKVGAHSIFTIWKLKTVLISIWMFWPEDPRAFGSSFLCVERPGIFSTSTTRATQSPAWRECPTSWSSSSGRTSWSTRRLRTSCWGSVLTLCLLTGQSTRDSWMEVLDERQQAVHLCLWFLLRHTRDDRRRGRRLRPGRARGCQRRGPPGLREADAESTRQELQVSEGLASFSSRWYWS